MSSIDKERLNDYLTPALRKRAFSALGVEFNGHEADASGEVHHLRLPDAIHSDGNPSLSINLDKGVAYDQGGDWKGNLFQMVQDARGCTFPEALEWVASQVGYEETKRKKSVDWNPFKDGEEVAAYQYTDESGAVLFEAVRFELCDGFEHFDEVLPKDRKKFLQRVPGKGWGRKKHGVKPVMYRLPVVLEAAQEGRVIFVVEGEKDVHTLEDAGFVATCNPQGAGKWSPRFTKSLAGARVVIIPDNDRAGIEHAENVAAAVEEAVRSVRIVELPGVGPGGDVTDWLEGSHSTKTLRELVESTPVYEPPTELPETQPAGKDETQAQCLIRLAESAEVWRNPKGECYATYPVRDHRESSPLRQKDFRQWLRHRFYQERQKPPGSQALQDAIETLAAKARFEGPMRENHLRVAGESDRIYVDLGDEDWKAAEITPLGWSLTQRSEARFARTSSLKRLREPRRPGNLGLLRKHVRVKDDENFALLLAWLVQALSPEGPYPLLVLTGEQGSGKTVTSQLIRSLVDPSHIPTRAAPRKEEDLLVAAENSWVLAFDNLSYIPNWLSDAFCRLATGGGFSTRKLYTNRDEAIFYSMRPVILNGIEDLTARPDLADRAVAIQLEAIPEEERQTEREVRAAFAEDKDAIFAGLLDATSTALRNIGQVQLEMLPRMADFAKWATAAEPAFPTERGTFERAYSRNRAEANRTALESDAVALAIQKMVEEKGSWHGKTSDLRRELAQGKSRDGNAWIPDQDNPPERLESHQALAAHLKRIQPVLRRAGIERTDSEGVRDRTFTLHATRGEEDDL